MFSTKKRWVYEWHSDTVSDQKYLISFTYLQLSDTLKNNACSDNYWTVISFFTDC